MDSINNHCQKFGQFVIGTFTAADTNVQAGFNGHRGFRLINAFQVRDVASSVVPEPGQVASSILLFVGIGGYIFAKRRKQTPVPTA